MTIAFVHGVPETSRIWEPLVAELTDVETVCLSPPGFGAPIPDGFDLHPDSYAAWLIAEVEALDGPVDVVGHDWGTGHVCRLVADRPDLVRTWSIDVVGLLHPDYVWHDTAQIWQTEGAGEEAIELMVSLPTDDLAAVLQEAGASANDARVLAEGVDADMGRAILGLYRGGAQPYLAELGARVIGADTPPGLAIIASDDPYVTAEMCIAAADLAGLAQVYLEGAAHWWTDTHAPQVASALRAHWQST